MSKSNPTTVINTTDIQMVNFIGNRKGKFSAIVKTQSGALVSYPTEYTEANMGDILNNWKKGALQTLEFTPDGSTIGRGLTVFARKGKKILWMDEQIAAQLKVGTVNQLFYNTNLYNQTQYQSVNAENWDSFVFTMNKKTRKK
jgi:hypothetical protein